jgi:hypothetical protein
MTSRMNRLLHSSLLVGLTFAGASFTSAQTDDNRAQFDAQRQGRFVYTPYTALGSPVVLPMDGALDPSDWLTGLDVNLGGILFPHVHVDTALGKSSANPSDLQLGHHDPNLNGFTWQNVELGLSGRFNEHFEAFGTYAGNVDSEGHWEGIYEEWFAKLQNVSLGMFGDFEVRGGRIYNRFGIQNTYHPHGFDWADQYLVNARLLGEDSLTIIGTDLTWRLPTPWTSQLDVALGVAPEGHGHHHHGEREIEGAVLDAEAAGFDDFMTVANWTNVYHHNDFHQFRVGGSGAWGDNQYGLATQIYGTHFEYQWRENGFLPGGRYFRWRTEAMWRRWNGDSSLLEEEHEEEEEEHGHEEDHDGEHHDEEEFLRAKLGEFGFYSSLLYGFHPRLEAGLRAEYVNGSLVAGLDDRFRMSPGLTYYPTDARNVRLRVQYNYDISREFGTDHSVWGQLSLTWGGPEVR